MEAGIASHAQGVGTWQRGLHVACRMLAFCTVWVAVAGGGMGAVVVVVVVGAAAVDGGSGGGRPGVCVGVVLEVEPSHASAVSQVVFGFISRGVGERGAAPGPLVA